MPRLCKISLHSGLLLPSNATFIMWALTKHVRASLNSFNSRCILPIQQRLSATDTSLLPKVDFLIDRLFFCVDGKQWARRGLCNFSVRKGLENWKSGTEYRIERWWISVASYPPLLGQRQSFSSSRHECSAISLSDWSIFLWFVFC